MKFSGSGQGGARDAPATTPLVAGDGRRKVCAEMSDEEARKIFCEEGFDTNRWFNEEGYEVETPSPERLWAQRMTTFEESLEEQDWRSILRAAN